MGFCLSNKTVIKLMHEEGLRCKIRAKRYNSYKGEIGKIAPNVLDRGFSADRPGQKWLTDVTEFKAGGQRVYLAPILDLYNGEIISYTVNTGQNLRPILDMFDKALSRRKHKGELLIHSDQGWQYQQKLFRKMLKKYGVKQSMSRKATCLDNAPMESFFGHLKCEMYRGESFKTVQELKEAIDEYIHYYNYDRIKLKLGGLSPVDYRAYYLKAA